MAPRLLYMWLICATTLICVFYACDLFTASKATLLTWVGVVFFLVWGTYLAILYDRYAPYTIELLHHDQDMLLVDKPCLSFPKDTCDACHLPIKERNAYKAVQCDHFFHGECFMKHNPVAIMQPGKTVSLLSVQMQTIKNASRACPVCGVNLREYGMHVYHLAYGDHI